MSWFRRVRLFEDYFQFDQLEDPVYCRFLELLQYPTSSDFLNTCKKHYKDYITSRGIDMNVWRGGYTAQLSLTRWYGTIYFATAEDYHKLERKHSKFWPYFKFNELSIFYSNKWEGKIDRDPIPVPKMYRRLVVWDAKHKGDIDYLVKEALHPGVEEIKLDFYKVELDKVMKLVHYTLTKIPGLSDYHFRIISEYNTEERVRELFKPPPSTRRMTVKVDDYHATFIVSYSQKEDL